jgi:hypothetical protein
MIEGWEEGKREGGLMDDMDTDTWSLRVRKGWLLEDMGTDD